MILKLYDSNTRTANFKTSLFVYFFEFTILLLDLSSFLPSNSSASAKTGHFDDRCEVKMMSPAPTSFSLLI